MYRGSEMVELLYQEVYLKWTSPRVPYMLIHQHTAAESHRGGEGALVYFDILKVLQIWKKLSIGPKIQLAGMLENHEHKRKTLINIKYIWVHREDDFFPTVVGLKIHKIEHGLRRRSQSEKTW